MKITSIASSSKGNSYLIESNGYQLLIDVGVPLKKIREHLPDGSFKNVVGCLVSHSHMDHCKHLPNLARETNVPIWCTEGTRNQFNLKSASVIENKKFFPCGDEFYCSGVHLDHDVECFGFGITNTAATRLFYGTDTANLNYQFDNLDFLMIECNYSFELLIESEQNRSVIQRICNTHLGIHQVEEFVKRHPDLQEIHLLHLSSSNSDEKEFKKRIQSIAGCVVKIAGE